MNKVVLIGRLTKDPEVSYMPKVNIPVTNVTIAIDRYNKLTGNKETDFIRAVIKGKQAKKTAEEMRKGGLIAIEGSIHTRSYETENKQKRYVVEVECKYVKPISNVIKENENIVDNDNDNMDYSGTPFE